MKTLLDSDILSEIVKAIDRNVVHNARLYLNDHPQLTLCSVSVYEILYGLYAKQAAKQAASFMALLTAHEEIVPAATDYRLAAEIRAALHLQGKEIGRADPLIAAVTLNNNLGLVTGNLRHYGYIQSAGFDLKLLNWRDGK